MKKDRHVWVLSFFIIAYILIFSILSSLRYKAFSSGLDLGNMDQTVWNTLHGRFFTLTNESGTVSRLAIHTDIALIFFAPFYLLWNNPNTLTVLASIFLGLGAIPTYLIANHVLRNKNLALIFSSLYLLNPALEWVNIFDFHAVSLAIPILLMAFYSVLKCRWKWYVFFICLALLTKESVSLQVAVMGLVVALAFKERKLGIATLLTGIVWFLTMVFVVTPYFSPQSKHWAFEWFQLGGVQTHQPLFQTLQTKLAFILERFLFNPEIRVYYSLLLKSSGFLPLLGFPWLILGLPDLVINILSSHSEMHSIRYHYTSGLIPAMIISSIYGVAYVSKLLKKTPISQKLHSFLVYLIVGTALLIVLRVNYHYSPLPTTAACVCANYKVTKEDVEFDSVLQSIPVDASVTASYEIHAHVTHREHSYVLPHATQSADFIALIDQNRVFENYFPKTYEKDLIDKLNKEKKYKLIKHIGHFFLYQKNTR